VAEHCGKVAVAGVRLSTYIGSKHPPPNGPADTAAINAQGVGPSRRAAHPQADEGQALMAKKLPMSKNAATIEQIELVCRQFGEKMAAGFTENAAIRTLEMLANGYGKFRAVGTTTPDHVRQYTLWSKAALAAKAANGDRACGQYLRCEHGTPRRDFAREVLAASREGKLTKEWMDAHCDKKWKVAVITHEEDGRLNKLKGTKFASPEARWAAAGIEFPRRADEPGELDQNGNLRTYASVEEARSEVARKDAETKAIANREPA
jgi:hypothetical protein